MTRGERERNTCPMSSMGVEKRDDGAEKDDADDVGNGATDGVVEEEDDGVKDDANGVDREEDGVDDNNANDVEENGAGGVREDDAGGVEDDVGRMTPVTP